MRADDLAVIGGAHGIAARLDDLAGAARHLRRAGLDLGLVAAVASEGMRNPGVMATAPLSPVTWAALEEALVRLAHPGALPLDAAADELRHRIHESYRLIRGKLPRKLQAGLGAFPDA